MVKHVILLMGTVALICAAGCQNNDSPMPETQVRDSSMNIYLYPPLGEGVGGKVLKTPEDVKDLFPDAIWLETQQGEARFMFCANDLPAYGSSRIDIHGWVFRRHSNQWERVFAVRLNGVGRVTISVDSDAGLFSAKGSANNKFLDKSVFTFDLRATEM
jgi:hypothetical protein